MPSGKRGVDFAWSSLAIIALVVIGILVFAAFAANLSKTTRPTVRQGIASVDLLNATLSNTGIFTGEKKPAPSAEDEAKKFWSIVSSDLTTSEQYTYIHNNINLYYDKATPEQKQKIEELYARNLGLELKDEDTIARYLWLKDKLDKKPASYPVKIPDLAKLAVAQSMLDYKEHQTAIPQLVYSAIGLSSSTKPEDLGKALDIADKNSDKYVNAVQGLNILGRYNLNVLNTAIRPSATDVGMYVDAAFENLLKPVANSDLSHNHVKSIILPGLSTYCRNLKNEMYRKYDGYKTSGHTTEENDMYEASISAADQCWALADIIDKRTPYRTSDRATQTSSQ